MTHSLRTLTITLAVITLTASACSDDPARVVFVGFDETGSNLLDAQRFGQEAETIVATLRPGTDRQAGDLLVGDIISDRSWSDARLRINAAFPRLDRAHSNSGAHRSHAEALRDSVQKQIDSLLANPPGGASDLLGFFEMPARVFAAHPEAEKRLVVFSDMIHTDDGVDFGSPSFTVERARELVGELQERGRIPDLSDVTVYISGIGASADLSPDQREALHVFWGGYFDASGATYESKNVGSTLIGWVD